MGHLILGLVLAGSLLAVMGPQQVSADVPADVPADVAPIAVPAGAAAAGDKCGRKPPPKENGKAWQCSFADNFNGKQLNKGRWKSFYDKVPSQKGSSCRRPKNAKVANGQLRLTVKRTGKAVGCQFTNGAVSTYHRFSQKYGRFQARIKVRATREPGLQESFWLWPDDRIESNVKWPAAGEIDVAETYSQWPDLAVPFLHYTANDNGGAKDGLNTAWDCKAKRGRWHNYTLLWGPDKIIINVDGKRCLRNTSGDRAFKKKYIVAFTQSVGMRGNRPTPDTPLPATMQVDYIRVWR
jgi:beta-glucanase (GH16 family)